LEKSENSEEEEGHFTVHQNGKRIFIQSISINIMILKTSSKRHSSRKKTLPRIETVN
jgi:hypothetical protein